MIKYLPWLLRLLGPSLLVIFLINSDLSTLITILRGVHGWPILLSLLLMPPFIFIKAYRWQYILRELHVELPFRIAIELYTIGIYLGSVTPGQSGDLVRAWYLRERGQPFAPALLSTMIDRLCDLLVMSGVAALGILALGRLLPDPGLRMLLIIAMGLGLTLLTVLLTVHGPRQWLLTQVLPTVLPTHLRDSLTRWNTQLASLTLHPRLVLVLASTSLISAAFTFYRLWLLFVSLDVLIPLSIVVGASALIGVLQILPISIAGFGVRDGVLIAVLASYGYIQEQALAVSALFLLLTIEHIIAGFIVSLWYPIKGITRKMHDMEAAENHD